MDNSNDRRVRKTKALIRQSLTQLLSAKELSDISVSELTKLSDISRGTFYLHYKNVFDLFEQTENELVADVCTIISDLRGQQQWPSASAMLDLFRYVAANADFFAAVLRVKETEFFKKLTDQLKPQTAEDWANLLQGADESMFEYCYAFVASGCTALLKQWFLSGMKERPEVIAHFASQLTNHLFVTAARIKAPS